MRKWLAPKILSIITVLCLASAASASGTDLALSTSEDNADFAFDLFSALSENEGNLFFSPYSISSALAMTYGGAAGETASQMEKALHFSGGQKTTHMGFLELQKRFTDVQAEGNVELSVANSIWPQQGYPFLPAYTSLLKEYYDVEVTGVDYARDHKAAGEKINRWVEDRTRKKITDLISPEALTPLTRLVLVNAIYFRGNWENGFDADDTVRTRFRVSPDKTVEADLMRRTGDYGYVRFDDFQMLELPYAGGNLSMIVLLPLEGVPLGDIEGKIGRSSFSSWKESLMVQKVEVWMPRFRITWGSFSLVKALRSLGMADAFSEEKADLSGMDGKKGWLYITDVLHKAFVDVNEEGTEAAAATAVIVGIKAVIQTPPVFRADRPFLFVIQEKSTGSILFMGRVNDPSKGE